MTANIDLDDFFKKNEAIGLLFFRGEDGDLSYSGLFKDTMLRLAEIDDNHEVTIERKHTYGNVIFTIKDLTLEEAKRLKEFLELDPENDHIERFEVAREALNYNIFAKILKEVVRQIHEDPKSLSPYFSIKNAIETMLLGAFEFTMVFEKHYQNPKLAFLIMELYDLVDLEGDMEKAIEKNADKIFAVTDKIMDFARKHDGVDQGRKENLIRAYDEIKALYLASKKTLDNDQKPLQHDIIPKPLQLDRNSNLFFAGNRSLMQEPSARPTYTPK